MPNSLTRSRCRKKISSPLGPPAEILSPDLITKIAAWQLSKALLKSSFAWTCSRCCHLSLHTPP